MHHTQFRRFIVPLYNFLVVLKKEILALWLIFSLNSLSVLNKLRNDKVLIVVIVLLFACCTFPLLYPLRLVETILSIKTQKTLKPAIIT